MGSVSVCVHSAANQSDLWSLNANSFVMVKAMDVIFGLHVPRDSRYPENFS